MLTQTTTPNAAVAMQTAHTMPPLGARIRMTSENSNWEIGDIGTVIEQHGDRVAVKFGREDYTAFLDAFEEMTTQATAEQIAAIKSLGFREVQPSVFEREVGWVAGPEWFEGCENRSELSGEDTETLQSKDNGILLHDVTDYSGRNDRMFADWNAVIAGLRPNACA